jgi:GTP-binding protein HflX
MRCSPRSRIALATTRVTLDLTIDSSDGAGISWLHRNAEVLDKHLEDGRFAMTVRVDISKRDITIAKNSARSQAQIELLHEEPSSVLRKT